MNKWLPRIVVAWLILNAALRAANEALTGTVPYFPDAAWLGWIFCAALTFIAISVLWRGVE